MNALTIGRWFIEHYRKRQTASGTFKVATQLRKQGVPLHITKLLLIAREEQPRTPGFVTNVHSFSDYEALIAEMEDTQ